MVSYPRLATNCSNEEQTIVPDNPSLSIIIPVFNVEKYLSMCLDSLLKTEGIDKTEIILIDDGSTDSSAGIADKFAEDHENARVIHKENEGPSASRNLGLMEAKGTYIFFCDSDDEVVPALFRRIIEITKTSDDDIIMWDSELLYETRNLLVPKNRCFFAHSGLEKTEKTYTGKGILETQLKNTGDYVATIWLGAYRRQYLINNHLIFEKGLIHEDELLLPKVFINAAKVHYIPEKIYIYRIRSGSIMNPENNDRSKSADALMRIYPSLYEYYDEVLVGNPLRDLIKANLTKRYLHMIYKYRIWRFGYGKKIDKKLLMQNSRNLKNKIMVLLLYVIAH